MRHGIASMVLNQCRSRVSLNGGTVGVVDSTSSSCSSGLLFKTVCPQPGGYRGVRLATRWLSIGRRDQRPRRNRRVQCQQLDRVRAWAFEAVRALILELSGLNFCAAAGIRDAAHD